LSEQTALLVAFGLVGLAAISKATVFSAETDEFYFFRLFYPVLNFPQFVLGVAIGRFFIRQHGPIRYAKLLFWTGVTSLSLILALKIDHQWIANSVLLSVTFGLIILGAGGLSGSLRTALSERWIVQLGELSYTIYIIHMPILLWWNHITNVKMKLGIPATLDFSAFVILTLLVSMGSFHLFEKRARHALIGKLWASDRKPSS
jgi:peptidoglycan/LPS O-acetylase OafA/YrhL